MATVPRLQRYYQGATTSCPRMSFGSLVSPAGSAGACRDSCPPRGALPPPYRPGNGPGSGFHAGNSPSSVLARGQVQDLPGSLATHPVTLRRSTTPDGPLRLASSGASDAAPTPLTMKASSFHRFRGLPRRFITCCLRFTTGVAARHARLASGWRAAPLPGGSRTRWIATRGFNSWHPPLQGLPWRNNGSVGPWNQPACGYVRCAQTTDFHALRGGNASVRSGQHGPTEPLRTVSANPVPVREHSTRDSDVPTPAPGVADGRNSDSGFACEAASPSHPVFGRRIDGADRL